MIRKLTPKQERFVDEYLKDLNATQAAIRAGYELVSDLNSFKEKYYVYFLIDPFDMSIFYVGKGTGRRMFAHCRAKNDVNRIKSSRINKIKNSGNSVIERIFSLHEDESDALSVERLLIKRLSESGLTNISSGERTSKESALAKIDYMLNSLLSYEVWASNISKEIYKSVEVAFGCPKRFYEKFKDELLNHKKLIENNGDLGNGWFYDFARHELCLRRNKKSSA